MMKQLKHLMLEVPDAEERDAFLSNARKVWNSHHPDKQKTPGKPGNDTIIAVLREVLLNPPKKTLPSIKHLTKLAETKFNDKTYMAQFPADRREPAAGDTIRRYAKLTLMLLKWARQDQEKIFVDDVAWLSKNVPASHLTVTEILDIVSALQPDITKVIESLHNVPRIVSESGIGLTPARSKSLQKALLAFPNPVRPAAGK
jgi:hypothetical protein